MNYLPLGVTSISTEGLWLAGEITFQNWHRNISSSGYFLVTSEHFFLNPITSDSLAGFLILFALIVAGTEKEKTLAVLHHRRSPAARESRISPKMCYQRGGRTTLIPNCLPQRNCPYFKITCRFKHKKVLLLPPTVSLLGSRLFWMYHKCWMSNLQEMHPFYFPLDCCNNFDLNPGSSLTRRRRPWPSTRATKTSP